MLGIRSLLSTEVVLGRAGLFAVALAAALAVFSMQSAVAEGPDEKAQIKQQYEGDKLRGLQSPHSKQDKSGPTVIQTNSPIPTGILETTIGPFPSSQFRATNRWQVYLAGQLVAVLAGGPTDTTLGRLVVVTLNKDGTNVLSERWVDLPRHPGRAHIASAQDNNLVIETTGGTKFTFNPTSLGLTTLP